MTTRLLRSMVQNEGVFKITAKFSQWGGIGRVYGCANISPRVFRAPKTMITMGTRMINVIIESTRYWKNLGSFFLIAFLL